MTFCALRPLRSLPFKVICLLGLHDQAFPRRDRLVEFDRMQAQWRPGDPRTGDEDRYLFLETLLCARQRLYISYVGRDIRNNGERQPSVLVRELLDYVDRQYRLAGGGEKDKLSERLSTVHPLQPFSPRNYAAESSSFDDYWCEVAKAMVESPEPQEDVALAWVDTGLPAAPESMRDVTAAQLDRFVRHPVRYFVSTRLGVTLQEEAPAEDDEPFTLDGLSSFQLKQHLVDEHLKGRTPSLGQLTAEGALPHGAFAELAYQEQTDILVPLIEKLGEYSQERPEQISVDLEFGDEAGPRRLTGHIQGIYPRLGLLRCKPSALKGPDILSVWLAHLMWCASGQSDEKRSTLYSTGESFTIAEALAPEEARAALARYLRWYWMGVHRPLLVLPKASYAYASAFRKASKVDPLEAARREWDGNSYQEIPGDKDDVYVQLVMRGVAGNPLEHEDFTRLAMAFYEQALVCGSLP